LHKNILTSNPSNHMPPFQILEDGSLGDLLMVVDMQNVYLEYQPWGCIETTLSIRKSPTIFYLPNSYRRSIQ